MGGAAFYGMWWRLSSLERPKEAGFHTGDRILTLNGLALDLGGDVLRIGELDFARTATVGSVLTEDSALLRVRAGLRVTIP